ncbi:Murein DD-endopeptidase MepM [termite gut metagenome]|uniref:Murein DD-endopeptidase MepM n=1 Tax=termite gut metagenome TaxID=433724 RepID=A0A5J4RIL8_9ZZZZ
MKHSILILSLIVSLPLYSQNETKAAFVPPFDFSLMLSANFGELRTNHLHGGLDIKTQGVSGKRLLSIGNGYISRILITHGSGHVLYVRYNNGYTAIYRHLAGFVSPVAERAAEYQQENETWEVVITPDSTEYPVHAGQHIAWSGNTGYSFGPHLHLDVFETETEDYVNALSFFKNKIKDTRPPVVHSMMLFPQLGKGAVKGSQKRLIFMPKNVQPIEAWGLIGAGIKAYDYMDETNNRYGVHTVTLSVDGKKIFHSAVDRFSTDESRMIYSWTYNSYMKSFIEPGNKLRMLQAFNDQRGLITIDEERDYKFDYELKDLHGNASHYRFVVRGKPQPVQPIPYNEKYYLKWDEVNHIHEPGLEMHIPKGALYDNVLLNYHVLMDSTEAVAFTYQFHDESVPLQTYSDLYIGVRNKAATIDSTKYYIARMEKDGKAVSLGGKYENGFVKTRVRELGTFTIKTDTVPPLITAVNPQKWSTTGSIVFKVEEKETDIHSYKGTIDGKYVPFGWEITSNRIIYKIDTHKIKRGVHTIELVATDECENEGKVRLTVTL